MLRPTWHKIGHFGDVLPSQSLGLVLKKLNLTQQKLEMWANAQRDGHLPNIGGALCSTRQSLADAHYYSNVQ